MTLRSLVIVGALIATPTLAQTTTPATNATTAASPGTTGDPSKAAGDSNQGVATTDANALQPAKGSNSFTAGEAQRRIEKEGYATVADLKKDDDGIWRGHATKDGAPTGVWLDYKGNIGRQ